MAERTRCPFCYRPASVRLVGNRPWWRRLLRMGIKSIRVCEHHIGEGVTAVR